MKNGKREKNAMSNILPLKSNANIVFRNAIVYSLTLRKGTKTPR